MDKDLGVINMIYIIIDDPGAYIVIGIILYIFIILITSFILSFFRINEKDKNLQNGIENLSFKKQIAYIRYLFSKYKMMKFVCVFYFILSYYIVLKILTTLSSNKFYLSNTHKILGVIIYLFILFITYIILNNITITEEEKKAQNGIENLSLKSQIVHIWHIFNKSNLLKIFTVLYILLVYYIIILLINELHRGGWG